MALYRKAAKQAPLPVANESMLAGELPSRTAETDTTAPLLTVARAEPEQDRKVTVEELVARIEDGGLPVRLRWEREAEGDGTAGAFEAEYWR